MVKSKPGSILVALFIALGFDPGSLGAYQPGSWYQYRGDRQLTGRSHLEGSMRTVPDVKWQHFIGSREWLLEANFHSAKGILTLPESDMTAEMTALERRYDFGGPYYDLDGKGTLTVLADRESCKIGDFLPGPGLEKVCATPEKAKSGYCWLYRWENGQWTQLWQSEAIEKTDHTSLIVADIDGDGRREVVVRPWYDICVLDIRTGGLKYKARFTSPEASSGRGYGWLGSTDLDGDGKQEVVILGDFENQIVVMGWIEEQFTRLWYRLIERGISNKKTIVSPGTHPLQDIDGDRLPEIVISLFNTTGDNKWHVLAYNGMTGSVKLDISDQYLNGMCDLDRDGIAELFCTAAPKVRVPQPSELSIYSFYKGHLTLRWKSPTAASFQNHEISHFGHNINSGAAHARKNVLAGPIDKGGRPVFLTRNVLDRNTHTIEMRAWQADSKGNVSSIGSLRGLSLDILGIRQTDGGQDTLLLRSRALSRDSAEIHYNGIVPKAVYCEKKGIPPTCPVVGRLTPGSSPAVVAQGAEETIEAFQLRCGGQVKSLWRRRGRCSFNSGRWYGLTLADLLGTGSLATIAATYGQNGCARVVALAPDGSEIWHRDFERFSGETPPWNVGGLTFFFAGRFTNHEHEDVMVSLRRSTMHSDETFVLDGPTGKTVWHRTVGASYGERGCGGALMTIYDYDEDGFDDGFSAFPDSVFVTDGPTGKLLLDRSTVSIFRKQVLYGVGTTSDFLGTGGRQIICAFYNRLVLLDFAGNVMWQKIWPGERFVQLFLPGIGDADGDKKLEVFVPDNDKGQLHCLDAATGIAKWNITTNETTAAPVTADIDGDGRDECLLVTGNTVVAIEATADGKTGHVLWTRSFPDRIGPPALADVDNSGKLSVIVCCSDGHVYGFTGDE